MSAYGLSYCEDHDDCLVIFTGKKCPVCDKDQDVTSEIAGLKEDIVGLQKDIEQIESKVP